MTDDPNPDSPVGEAATGTAPRVRELVALFADRTSLEGVIKALRAAGFRHSDLSLLDSHEPIDVAAKPGQPLKGVLAGLAGEVKYIDALANAGYIAVTSGPVGALLATLVAAGVGGAAAKELLDEVMATTHSEEFARALEAGEVILWVRVDDPEAEARARKILAHHGGRDIHAWERAAGPPA